MGGLLQPESAAGINRNGWLASAGIRSIQRLGQTAQFVLVNNLVISNSLEETILARLFERLDLFSLAIGELEAILSETSADEGRDFEDLILTLIELQAQGRDEEIARQLENMNRSAAKAELRKLQEENDQLLGSLRSSADEPHFTRSTRADPPLDVGSFAEAAFRFLGERIRFEEDGRILCALDSQRSDLLFPKWRRFVFEDPGTESDDSAPKLLAEGTKAFVELTRRVLKRGGVALKSCKPLEQDPSPEVLQQSIGAQEPRVRVNSIDSAEDSEEVVWGLTWVLTPRASRDRFDKVVRFLIGESDAGRRAIQRLQVLPAEQLLHLPQLSEPRQGKPPLAEVSRQLDESIEADGEVCAFGAHYEHIGRQKIQTLHKRHEELMTERRVFGAARDQANRDRDRKSEALKQEYKLSVEARVAMVEGFAFRRMRGKATCQWAENDNATAFQAEWSWVPLTASGSLLLKCEVCEGASAGPDTTCETGHLACERHIHQCAVQGCTRRTCPKCLPGRLKKCELSGLLSCPDHLVECASCGAATLALLAFTVEELERPVCAECFEVCAGSGELHLTTELERSAISGALVHHRLLVTCPETQIRALARELKACEETGVLVDPRVLEVCAASGKLVLPRLLVASPVSAKRFLPSFGERDEVTGELCLPEDLGRSAVSGLRVRRDRLAQSTLTGTAALRSEMVTCPLSGDSLLPSEVVVCGETGRQLSPRATATCGLTGVRAGQDQFGTCAISGELILMRVLVASALSGKLARPDLMGVDEVDGVLALPDELAVCSVTGKRVLGVKLAKSEISDRRALPGALVACQETGQRVCPDELLTCQASGALVVPTCLAIDEVTGRRVLERLLVTCGITGKRTLSEETEECVLSGVRALRSECEQCAITGQWAVKGKLEPSAVSCKRVLPPLLRQSAVTSAKALPEEMVRCEESGALALPGELETCSVSGKAVVPSLLMTCPDTGARLLGRLAVKCDSTGVFVHPSAIAISEASGRLVRSVRLVMSAVSARRCLQEELGVCAVSEQRVLADELERCAVTGKSVLPRYLGPCAICERKSLRKSQVRCVGCQGHYCARCIERGHCTTCVGLSRPLQGIESLEPGLQRAVHEAFPSVGRIIVGRNSKWVLVYAEPKKTHLFQKPCLLVAERRGPGYSVLRSNHDFRLP